MTVKKQDQNSKIFAIIAHLSIFTQIFVLIPLVMYFASDNKFIKSESISAINFQLNILLISFAMAIIAIPLTLVTFGLAILFLLPFFLVLLIYALVMPIVASIQVFNDNVYEYPFTYKFLK